VSGETLSAGGFDLMFGTAVSTIIDSGGIALDYGTALGTQVNSGGIQALAVSGALASGTVVSGTNA